MTAAERFKKERAKMKSINEGKRLNPNVNVNKLTSEEFSQLQKNRDKNYNRMISNVLSVPRIFPAITLGIMKYGGKGIDNTKRLFAPSDKKVMQKRMEKAVGKKYLKKRK